MTATNFPPEELGLVPLLWGRQAAEAHLLAREVVSQAQQRGREACSHCVISCHISHGMWSGPQIRENVMLGFAYWLNRNVEGWKCFERCETLSRKYCAGDQSSPSNLNSNGLGNSHLKAFFWPSSMEGAEWRPNVLKQLQFLFSSGILAWPKGDHVISTYFNLHVWDNQLQVAEVTLLKIFAVHVG